jgi:hypothetical protein
MTMPDGVSTLANPSIEPERYGVHFLTAACK